MSSSFPFLFLDIETTEHQPLMLVNNMLSPWHEIIEIGGVYASNPKTSVYFRAYGNTANSGRVLPRTSKQLNQKNREYPRFFISVRRCVLGICS